MSRLASRAVKLALNPRLSGPTLTARPRRRALSVRRVCARRLSGASSRSWHVLLRGQFPLGPMQADVVAPSPSIEPAALHPIVSSQCALTPEHTPLFSPAFHDRITQPSTHAAVPHSTTAFHRQRGRHHLHAFGRLPRVVARPSPERIRRFDRLRTPTRKRPTLGFVCPMSHELDWLCDDGLYACPNERRIFDSPFAASIAHELCLS
ncbi:hypothetical protein FA95DRAFT_1395318 [Auriscalpium vulgare]|uniref:Uncharacterized protein n=1 Tax=Auriscalpium vulgare TaxID=40419 RepID=A0ACB8RRW8_9AGAM|nr:hypothetical protein FA95DRAFT_1395318 [Auriscalpium vulgare]